LINEILGCARLAAIRFPFLVLGVIAEKNSSVSGTISHRRRAVGGCWLLARRNVVEPDTAHASRREKPGRHRLIAALGLLRLRFLRDWTLGFSRACRDDKPDRSGQSHAQPTVRLRERMVLHGWVGVHVGCQIVPN